MTHPVPPLLLNKNQLKIIDMDKKEEEVLMTKLRDALKDGSNGLRTSFAGIEIGSIVTIDFTEDFEPVVTRTIDEKTVKFIGIPSKEYGVLSLRNFAGVKLPADAVRTNKTEYEKFSASAETAFQNLLSMNGKSYKCVDIAIYTPKGQTFECKQPLFTVVKANGKK